MTIGRHLVADLYGVPVRILRDEQGLMRLFREALERLGVTIIAEHSHRFSDGGEGVTGIFLLAESHAAFHTYPERCYMAVDVFTCGSGDPEEVLRLLTSAFAPGRTESRLSTRGALCASVADGVDELHRVRPRTNCRGSHQLP